MHCSFSQRMGLVIKRIQPGYVYLPHRVDFWMMELLHGGFFKNRKKVLWSMAWRAVLWSLWFDSNRRMF